MLSIKKLNPRIEKKINDEKKKKFEMLKLRKEEFEKKKTKADETIRILEKECSKIESESFGHNEEEYQLHNSIERARIRLRQGRPEPFDLILKNFSLSIEFGMDLDPPFINFSNLSLSKLEDISHSATLICDLTDRSDSHTIKFWQNILIVIDHEIKTTKKVENIVKSENMPITQINKNEPPICSMQEQEVGIHIRVEDEIKMFLAEKTFNELKKIEKEIFIQKDKDKTLDLKYWHIILKFLKVQKAIVWLKDLHNGAYKKYLETFIKHNAKEIILNWKILSPVCTSKTILLYETNSFKKLTHKVESNDISTTINNSSDK